MDQKISVVVLGHSFVARAYNQINDMLMSMPQVAEYLILGRGGMKFGDDDYYECLNTISN